MKKIMNAKEEWVGVESHSKERGNNPVPVFDVRRNRKLADRFIKQQNISTGSKFIRPSYSVMGYSYN